MRITHRLTFRELDGLGSDAALVPILRSRGMPLISVPNDPFRNFIQCEYDTDYEGHVTRNHGLFNWRDDGAGRTFIWEGLETDALFPEIQIPANMVQSATTCIAGTSFSTNSTIGVVSGRFAGGFREYIRNKERQKGEIEVGEVKVDDTPKTRIVRFKD